MENAGVGRGCFRWHIYDPFLRGRNLRASFYLGSPTVTHWKVTIKPDSRICLSFWRFFFFLEFDKRFESQNEIVIDRLLIHIKLDGMVNTPTVKYNEIFNENNQFTFSFDKTVIVYPRMEPHLLDVRIEISLPGRAIQNEMGSGLFSNDNDLKWLSEDLDVLLCNEKYFNMKLVASDDPEPLKVHSYIINARWDNFFQHHRFVVSTHDTVQIGISHDVLTDIINYMYTGAVPSNWPDWNDVDYSGEMFQVIQKYKLYHLYKVFAKTDLLQFRVTKNHVLIASSLFPLDIVNNHLKNDVPHMWYVNLNTEYEFIFRIQLWIDNKEGPLISYSLQSRSSLKLGVEVNLQVVKREGGNDLQRVWHFHAYNLIIHPYETVTKESVRFHGYPEAFQDIDTVSSDGSEIKYFVQCFFNVINGNTVMQVRSERSDKIQDEKIRFNVLSNHLYKLRKELVDTDMVMLSELEPNMVAYPIHKGILATRLPQVGENFAPNIIPNAVKSRLSKTTLPVVLDYMYTGKLFAIPIPELDEIADFAEDTMFYSIDYLVKRIKSFYLDC